MVALPLMCTCYSVQQHERTAQYSNVWTLLSTAICVMLATSSPPDVCDATGQVEEHIQPTCTFIVSCSENGCTFHQGAERPSL